MLAVTCPVSPQAPSGKDGGRVPGVPPAQARGRAPLLLSLPCGWALSLSPRGPSPESPQPCPQPAAAMVFLPRVTCVRICAPDTQRLLEGRATSEWPGTQWPPPGLAWGADKAGKGKERGSFSAHRPIGNASKPLRLCDRWSLLLRARPGGNL